MSYEVNNNKNIITLLDNEAHKLKIENTNEMEVSFFKSAYDGAAKNVKSIIASAIDLKRKE